MQRDRNYQFAVRWIHLWGEDDGQMLECYDYASLGGYVIPIQFMTSDWSYFEFSHQFILMVIV